MTATDSEESLDLDAIEARATAATPPPWVPRCDYEDSLHWLCNDKDFAQILGGDERIEVAGFFVRRTEAEETGIDPADKKVVSANVTFIAHAREDVPALVAEVRALNTAVAILTEQVEGLQELARDHERERHALLARAEKAERERDEARAEVARLEQLGEVCVPLSRLAEVEAQAAAMREALADLVCAVEDTAEEGEDLSVLDAAQAALAPNAGKRLLAERDRAVLALRNIVEVSNSPLWEDDRDDAADAIIELAETALKAGGK